MTDARNFWELILGTVIALLPIINPLASAPTFLAITEGDSHERRLRQLRNACLYMVAILVAFLVGGTFIMSFFGLSTARRRHRLSHADGRAGGVGSGCRASRGSREA